MSNEISALIYEVSGLRHEISAYFLCLSLSEWVATDACWDNAFASRMESDVEPKNLHKSISAFSAIHMLWKKLRFFFYFFFWVYSL